MKTENVPTCINCGKPAPGGKTLEQIGSPLAILFPGAVNCKQCLANPLAGIALQTDSPDVGQIDGISVEYVDFVEPKNINK